MRHPRGMMTAARWTTITAALLLPLAPPASTAGERPAPPAAGAPAARSDGLVRRIAFGSCIGQDLPQPIWDRVIAAKPDLFVFLGDNVYADTEDMAALRAAYGKLAAQPGWERLKKATRILATWDDHDYGKDDAGREYPKRAESQQVFLDFFGVPKDSPRRARPGVYHAETFGPPGKRVQVVLLDTRYFRSPLEWREQEGDPEGRYLPNTDPEATLLGAEQWAWLEERLREPAQVRVIASSIQVVEEDHGGEKWANFPRERKRLFELIWNTRVTGLFFISGDRHYAELSMMNGGAGFPIYDVTASSINWSQRQWRPIAANRHRVATLHWGDNFGLVTIDWDRADPLITFEARDEDGDPAFTHKIPLSVLRDGTM